MLERINFKNGKNSTSGYIIKKPRKYAILYSVY